MSTEPTRNSGTVGCDGQPIMSLALMNHSDVAVITVTGEVDLGTADLVVGLVNRVATCHPDRVVVDMTGVTFFGAAGVAALLRARDVVCAAGGRLLLRAPSRQTRWVLAITETDRVFQYDRTLLTA
jgi:anti-sigma B factor antagonist